MSQTLSPSVTRCYGMARVASVWKISRASVYRSLKETPPNTIARRPGPVGACSDAELAEHIRQHIAACRLHGEGYRKLWARLRFAGVRTSPRRVRRVMRENGLLAPHRVGRTEARPHDGTIITNKINEMWGTDMTQTITIREGRANVFVAVEHANSEVVGIHASRSANRFEALEPVRQGVHRCFGAIAPGVARGLKLRHDHGSNYMSGDFQDEIECLGIEASPSFVREPEGNGVAERNGCTNIPLAAVGAQEDETILEDGFFRPCADAVRPPGSARTDQVLEDLRIRSALIVRYVSSRLPR